MPQANKKLKSSETGNEYVVGNPNVFNNWNNETRDRVETRLNKISIDRMRLDAEIESDVDLLFSSVLSDGIVATSVITDEGETPEEIAEFTEAQEIADFINLAISDSYATRPIAQVAKEMCKNAFYSGVKVGEIVLKYQQDSRIDGKLVLARVNPKPNSATAFVTDKFYNVLGLVGAKREGQTVVSTSISLSKGEIIPLEKFLIFQFELEDNDPRGLSQVRAGMEEYCDKQTTRLRWKEWQKRCAIPGLFGTTQAGEVKVKDANGQDIIVNGRPKTVTKQRAMMDAIEGYGNNSAVVGNDGDTLIQLEVSGEGEPFERAIKYHDSKLRKLILGDSLVSSEADKDARAARESSKDVTDIRKQLFRSYVSAAIKKCIFRLLTVVNFGEEKAHLTPDCFLGDTEANDLADDMNAYAQGGYEFADEHFREIDKRLGFTPRDKDWRQQMPDDTEQLTDPDEETDE